MASSAWPILTSQDHPTSLHKRTLAYAQPVTLFARSHPTDIQNGSYVPSSPATLPSSSCHIPSQPCPHAIALSHARCVTRQAPWVARPFPLVFDRLQPPFALHQAFHPIAAAYSQKSRPDTSFPDSLSLTRKPLLSVPIPAGYPR